MSLAEQIAAYHEYATLVQQQTGKSLLRQLREIRALKGSGGQCGISDYYSYKLYDDDYQMGRGAQDYLGWRLQQQFSLALNPRYAVLPAWDKLAFTVMAGSAGLPVAPIRACYHRASRISEMLGMHLRSPSMAGEFLRNQSIYPLFGKPVFSQQGHGAAFLKAYDPATDSLILLDGQTISIDAFLQRLENTVEHRYHKPECGFIFQDALKPAPEIQALTNWSAICGVRVICLNGADGVKPILAVWKIAVPPNHVDNFSLGKYGNLRAYINLETGEVSRMLKAFWPKSELLSKHPVTGQSINGFHIPYWGKILETCKQAGSVFPLMRVQHWDFALTDQGPLILELNDLGGTIGEQIHGQGLLTAETREFIKRYANRKAHPWVAQL